MASAAPAAAAAAVAASSEASQATLLGSIFGGTSALTVTLVVGVLPVVLVFWPSIKAAVKTLNKPRKGPPEKFPEDGVWDLATLARFNGETNPLCLGVCGTVVDVSSSDNIKYNEGAYGTLWAGNDATYSLATLSLEAKDVNKLDFKLSDLTKEQHTALAGWYKHFTTKYTIVGRLKEWEGFDFSSVAEEAKSQNPFGAGKDAASAGAAGAAPAEGAAAAAATTPEVGVMFAKGDKVEIRNCTGGREEFNGKTGILITYSGQKKGFEVRLDDSGDVQVFTPGELKKDS